MKNNNLIHSLEDNTQPKQIAKNSFVKIIIIMLTVGIIGGYVASMFNKPGNKLLRNPPKGEIVGIADKKTFKDQAEGILKEGGIEGEGNFHLIRPGGPPQNVYLTSTTVDLSQYVNKKIKVWGATFEGQKAGWLMDVGLVEVL